MTTPASAAGTVGVGDLQVPRMGYGTMRLTGPGIFGPPADRDEAVRVLRRAVDLGVRVIDTAWYYGPYVADELVAEALHPYPADLVVVCKLGGARRDDGSWYSDLTPTGLRNGCEHDLRLLRIDSIPVVHLRWMETADTTFDEALDTFVAMCREGKIQRIGLSNISLEQLERALQVTDVVTVSNAYSVVDRSDDDVVRRCEAEGIAYLPFFPLGASPRRSGATADQSDAVSTVADRRGVTPIQVALAWLLARSPVMLPIPGTSSVAHLEENLAAAQLTLTPDDLALLG